MLEQQIEDMIQFLRELDADREGIKAVGLIVRERGSRVGEAEILAEVSKRCPAIAIEASSMAPAEAVSLSREHLLDAGWPVLMLRSDPAPEMIDFLRGLGRGYGLGSGAGRLLVIADRQEVERRFSYKDFYSLFGPVCSV